jgi:translation initiation factor 2 subunit 1
MALKKSEWPEVGDLLIATVTRITDYGAYVTLDEYNKEGLLHRSEVSSSWIRNIRDYVREGQKVVLKVLRVDPEKGHIDLSLRRVTKRERIEKIFAFKRERKAESLLRSASEKLKIPYEELYEKIGVPIEKELGDIYTGLEEVAKKGADVLLKLGVPENIATAIEEITKEKIRVPKVKVQGTLTLRSTHPKGVNIIRDAILNAQKTITTKDVDLSFYVIAAPKYRIEVSAENYKIAEQVLQKIADAVIKNIKKMDGEGSFTREK